MGDGVDFLNYNEMKFEVMFIFSDLGNYIIKGRVIVKYIKIGYWLVVEFFMIILVVFNVIDIVFICFMVYFVNFMFSCFL